MAECKDCIHFEVCAYARHDLPSCDSFATSAVPVVRCQECRHGKRGVDSMVRCSHPCGKVISMTAGDFCSYGQRKEADHEVS